MTPAPRLLVITDLGAAPAEQWLSRLARLASAALPKTLAVVLREHDLAARRRVDFGRALRALTHQHEQELWVADRLDLALLLEADSLHLGEQSVPASRARTWWKKHLSRAWHAPTLAAEAELDGVDALVASPILAARKGRDAAGVERLRELRRQLEAGHPAVAPRLYALGGVDAANAASCLAAGAWGVAAIGAALRDEPAVLLASVGIAR